MKKIKTVLMVLLAGLLMVSLVMTIGCTSPAPSQAKPVPSTTEAKAAAPTATGLDLKLVTQTSIMPPGSLNTKRFIEIANEMCKGELSIKWIGGPESMSPMDVPGAVQKGAVDIAESLHSALVQQIPGLNGITMSELSFAEMRANGACDYIDSLFSKAGLKYLATINYVPPQKFLYFISNKTVKTLDDFKGLKIANPSPMWSPLWKTLGAENIMIPRDQNYEAIQRVLVNGIADPISGIMSAKVYEVAKYLVDMPFATQPSSYYMNLNVWNKFSPKAQGLLKDAIIKYDSGVVEWYRNNIDEPGIQEMKKAGVQFIVLSAADEKKFRDTLREVFWSAEIQKAPEVSTKLKELLTKK